MINGLLSQKPESKNPTVGDTKCFIIEQRISQSGKAWNKVRNAKPEDGGQWYRIMSANNTHRQDSYGNISFNVGLEPGQAPVQPQSSSGTKDSYWESKTEREIENQPRFERRHAQTMAVQLVAACPSIVQDEKGKVSMKKLRWYINWFVKDIGSPPLERIAPTPEEIGMGARDIASERPQHMYDMLLEEFYDEPEAKWIPPSDEEPPS